MQPLYVELSFSNASLVVKVNETVLPVSERAEMTLFLDQSGWLTARVPGRFESGVNPYVQIDLLTTGETPGAVISSDTYGLLPFYYAILADGSFALTNDILKLRRKLSSVQLDEQAFYELVRFGHCYGTKTLIKSIYRLPALFNLSVSSSGMRFSTTEKKRSFPTYVTEKPEKALDRPAIDRVHQAFQQSLKSITGDIVVSLSSGFDSRYVVATLAESGRRFSTFTTHWPVNDNYDADIARYVTSALRVPNYFSPLQNDFMYHWAEKKLELVNYETTMHDWLVGPIMSAPWRGASHIDGLAGDIIVRASNIDEGLHTYPAANAWKGFIGHMLRGMTMNDTGALFAKEADELFGNRVLEEVHGQLETVGRHIGAATHIFMFNRIRRAISPAFYGIYSNRFSNFSPFLSEEFLDATMSIAPAQRKTLYARLFERFPKLAEIPSQSKVGLTFNEKDFPIRPPKQVSYGISAYTHDLFGRVASRRKFIEKSGLANPMERFFSNRTSADGLRPEFMQAIQTAEILVRD
jgi:hypothetical protein